MARGCKCISLPKGDNAILKANGETSNENASVAFESVSASQDFFFTVVSM